MSINEFVSIPTDKLSEMIGRPIHLRWANHGCVWILLEVEGEVIHLQTPKTDRILTARAVDACYTRYWENKHGRGF
jgi:hypothetical protein